METSILSGTKLRGEELRKAIVAEVRAVPFPTVRGVAAEIEDASAAELTAYMRGSMHDGTWSSRHGTIRIAQSSLSWLWSIENVLQALGSRSWCYQEGCRNVFVVESTFKLDQGMTPGSLRERAAYLRGYFDAEGGVPRDPSARFYIQFVQRDGEDLKAAKGWLERLGIKTGRMHNPSRRVDPEYWRFYVLSRSHLDFARMVGAWHLQKRVRLEALSTRR